MSLTFDIVALTYILTFGSGLFCLTIWYAYDNEYDPEDDTVYEVPMWFKVFSVVLVLVGLLFTYFTLKMPTFQEETYVLSKHETEPTSDSLRHLSVKNYVVPVDGAIFYSPHPTDYRFIDEVASYNPLTIKSGVYINEFDLLPISMKLYFFDTEKSKDILDFARAQKNPVDTYSRVYLKKISDNILADLEVYLKQNYPYGFLYESERKEVLAELSKVYSDTYDLHVELY